VPLFSMAFNPITLAYYKSIQGEFLKERDMKTKERAFRRAQNLDKHFNSGYDLFTGDDRTIMEKLKENNLYMNLY
jgi:hypothetical protein